MKAPTAWRHENQPASLSWERAIFALSHYSGFFWEKLTSGVVMRS